MLTSLLTQPSLEGLYCPLPLDFIPGGSAAPLGCDDAGGWGCFPTGFSGFWTGLVKPISLWASSAVLGDTPVLPSNGSGLNPLEHHHLPAPTRSLESLSLPPCLLLMPLCCQLSSCELGLSRARTRRAHGIPCVPPSPCNASQGIATVRGRKSKPSVSTCGRQGKWLCKVSSAFKEVLVWGLFSYPLGNFTAEEAGPFRQWPKQYPHCLSSSRSPAELGAEPGKRSFFEGL